MHDRDCTLIIFDIVLSLKIDTMYHVKVGTTFLLEEECVISRTKRTWPKPKLHYGMHKSHVRPPSNVLKWIAVILKGRPASRRIKLKFCKHFSAQIYLSTTCT